MIVGLTGPARCGKNTIADHLIDKYGFTRIAFSDALYKEVAEAFDMPEEVLRDDATKDAPQEALAFIHCRDEGFVHAMYRVFGDLIPEDDAGDGGNEFCRAQSPRSILQWWGTEYRRAQDPDYWVKRLAERMCQIDGIGRATGGCRPGDYDVRVAVDGVRFPNEEAYLRSLLGFEMWHIYRADAPQVAGHVSEVEQKRITVDVERDAVIQNNGTIPQLWAIVNQLIEGRV